MTDDRRKMVIWVSAGVAVALLVGVAAGYLLWGAGKDEPPDQVAEEQTGEGLASEAATWTVEEPPANTEEPATEQPAASQPVDTTAPQVTGPSEVQPGYVQTVVNADGTWKLTIDYIQFLTGAEAAAAATAHGDESPPPNDYYVVNDNPKIREFPIQAGIGVVAVTYPDGGCDPQGHVVSLSEWASSMSGPQGDIFRSNIYWVTVTNGTITEIRGQYVP